MVSSHSTQRAAKPLQFPMDFRMQIKCIIRNCYSSTGSIVANLLVRQQQMHRAFNWTPSFALHYSLLVSTETGGIQMLLCVSAGNTVVISKRVCSLHCESEWLREQDEIATMRCSAPVDGRTDSDSTVQSRHW